jgi:hypothetical protein
VPAADEDPKDPHHFGDVVEAPWLLALYLAADAKLIQKQRTIQENGREKTLVYLVELDEGRAVPDAPDKDLVQAHADIDPPSDAVAGHARNTLRRAMILTDTCEINKTNRICLAPVLPLPTDTVQLGNVFRNRGFSRLGVRPAHEPGNLGFRVDFTQIFSISSDALDRTTTALRVSSVEVSQFILRRWCAHVTRHGPRVTADGVRKLAKLMEANGDPAEIERLKGIDAKPQKQFSDAVDPLEKLLGLAWVLEGLGLDQVTEAFEKKDGPQAVVAALIESLRLMEEAAHDATVRLGSLHGRLAVDTRPD